MALGKMLFKYRLLKIVMVKFDCVIIGGGMVGAASALVLASQGLKVAVVETHKPQDFTHEQALDLRVSAISLASQHQLEQLGAWQQIKKWRACPYKRLAVWEQEYAYTEFNAQDIAQKQLGHIVENRLIQLALWQQIAEQANIEIFCPETLVDLQQVDDKVILTLTQRTLQAKLVIGADGGNSKVRSLANIGITSWDYQQAAMLINVETSNPPQDITWQQFSPTGPVAFLPLSKNSLMPEMPMSKYPGYASLVWYHQQDEIKRLVALPNEKLQQAILDKFPKRLGEFKVIDKAAFPLTRRHANRYQKKRVLLLGDAAHTINPLAGQGVNLGFKDVKALQMIIASAIAEGKCWHDVEVLHAYEKLRRNDNLFMQTTMDALYFSFSHPSFLVKSLRNLSLFAINNIPFINSRIKNKALAYACGL